MRLYRLEIRNFKSFGPKETILDVRPGLTMIGGPNGSGKSNIGDALLFVLGTRSSKTVRADKLEDLIHTSKDGSRRSNSAVVKAIFVEDSPDGDFNKVELSRIIEDSNGEVKSTYYLNDRKAKHSEIEKFLDDAGIQLDSYSFVLQGDINDFISRTGNERRKLLESIGGIESYNMKIDAAKEKIGSIESNLSAARTLEGEISANAEALQREAEKLHKKMELEEKVRNLRKTSLSIQVRSMEIDMSSYSHELEVNLEKKEAHQVKIQEMVSKQESIRKKKEEIENGVSQEIRIQLAEIRKKLDNLKLEKARDEINSSNTLNTMSEKREKVELNSDKIEEIENELKLISEKFVKLKNRDGEIKSRHSVMKAQIAQKIEIQKSISTQYQKISKDLKDTEDEIRELQNQLKDLRSQESKLSSEVNTLTATIGGMEESLTSEKYALSEARWNISSIKGGDTDKVQKKEKLSNEYFNLGKQIETMEKERHESSDRIEFLVKEVEKLRSMLGNVGITGKASSIIMDAKSKGVISGIHRPLGDLISYDSKFQSAIDAAAGARLNSMVVDNEDVAQECIELLKSKQAGRLTFLPLNKLLGGRPRGKAIIILNEGKSLGLLSQNIEYEKSYENAVWYAFQDTILVDTMEMAKKYMTGVKIVTLDGDIFDASGAITGGFREKKERRGNPQDLIRMEDELSALRVKRQESESQLREYKQRKDSVQNELMEISKTDSEGKGKMSELQKRVEGAEKKIADITTSISKNSSDRSLLEKNLKGLREDIEKSEESMESLEDKKKKLLETLGDSGNGENDLTEMQRELENLTQEMSDVTRDMEGVSTTQNHLMTRKKEVLQDNSTLVGEIEKLKEKLEGLSKIMMEKDQEIQKHVMMENEINQRNTQIYSQIRALDDEINSISNEKERISREITSIDTSILTARIKIQGYEEKLSGMRTEMNSIEGFILQEYSSVQRINMAIQESERGIGEIGPVNQLALAELDREESRLSELREKIELLNQEIDSLLKVMAELEDVKKTTFMSLYNRVKEEMRRIFSRITNGGDVIMYLSSEDDPLNSELLVKARPKGTVYSKLNSLSGGEKSLVALSFISAVQRIKPSPVYFLDEIDMFLDGSNAESMGKLLKENSLNAQIIMISLKNAITKYSSSLIGVTMNRETNTTEIFSKSFDYGEGITA